ncbi:tetratricopeptide repeat protein [Portibacter marinus]|uniref:tetratricopeptide repeat protein n=1 Tax=Portibacter marinus TaxID=2898660 RepID=UPI001F436A01|nr:tetratricopeptide repeat protein [Portibacter marinus]
MRIFICTLFLFVSVFLSAQDTRLANQYYNTGEYEKAAEIYKQLFEKSKTNSYYFNRYINCLLSLELYDESEDVIKKQLKKRPNDLHLHVTLGNMYDRMQQEDKAKAEFDKAITKLDGNRSVVTQLGNAFIGLAKYDYAILAYEKGTNLLTKGESFAYNLGDLYRRSGNKEKMIKYYLLSIAERPERMKTVQTIFQRNLDIEDLDILLNQLYANVQENPDVIEYTELLQWSFIQKKDYKRALRQAKALDKRLNETGVRIYNLGQVASNAGDYPTAIDAFEYLLEEKDQTSPFYFEAKREKLANKRRLITSNFDYTRDDLLDLENEYKEFIDNIGFNTQSAFLVIELARLKAEYLDNLPEAIQLLDSLISFEGVNKYILANAKLNLGDYYLMTGDIWEASLLYSQVDKDFREDFLGEKARFKNALLSYYNGDFEWSQTQFDILKASTSKLISNDAIDRSVFILDNMGTDSIVKPLEMYAETELLIFQNKYDEALNKLDSIKNGYVVHPLRDDILYLEANIFKQRKEYDKAIIAYNAVITLHPEEIRCDNSLFELAEMYEVILDQPDKAMELYEKLFIEFSNSTYAVEARKRFRKLRGDEIQ